MKNRIASWWLIAVAVSAMIPAAPGAEKAAAGRRVVFMIGEDEYKTETTLPAFAKSELEPLGVAGVFINADARNPNEFPGLIQALKNADLLFVSVRRRTPPADQLEAIKKHLDSGKPLVGIRTASHAFALREGRPETGYAAWPEFDSQVLGGKYTLPHLANKEGTNFTTVPHVEDHAILTGVTQTNFHSGGTLYRYTQMSPRATVLLRGMGNDKGEVAVYPVAWTNQYGKSRVFYTSGGHPDDFQSPVFRKMLANAALWAMNVPIAGAEKRVGNVSAERNKLDLTTAANADVAAMIQKFKGKGEVGDDSRPTPPEEAAGNFQTFKGFKMELVASEPQIAQPLYISFDHRGRMWVVQYRQYPMPAGLKVVKYDQYLRAIFDKVPEPPPHGVKGLDRVTVLEDADGDGKYESIRDVITGLNIVSSVVVGRGRIWVLNPPYLLSYPDADDDGVPDGDPAVEISGFGLEDTHSVTNSLRWGPDGWLYAANGSTTTATINTAATKNLHYKGQCIWRFHPVTKVFEIFGEGGGNTFSTEFDSKGRAFSGTNGGNTRGMHYVQGMYGEKNWGKHGPLTNPYAFGFFEHMKHEGFNERFPQAFMIYEGGSWPAKYNHNVINANSLHNRVQASELIPDTSTWRTRDTDLLAITPDRWFRPVDIKAGPDGNVYLADWYDSRLTHVDPRDNWHKASGRLYRLRYEGASNYKPVNLAKTPWAELLANFSSPNKWLRQATQVVLADRKDAAILPAASKMLFEGGDAQASLEALWAIHSAGGLSDELALKAMDHADPFVRLWAVRLIGDRRECSAAVGDKLKIMACNEANVEVRSQLAGSAKRLPGAVALPMIRGLALHGEDATDVHLPLRIWWAMESKAASDRAAMLEMMSDKSLWSQPIFEKFLVGRLMRRYALAGEPEDLLACAKLLEMSPDPKFTRLLVEGMDEAFKGRSLSDLPPALAKALAWADSGSRGLSLALRQGDKAALAKALKIIGDEKAGKSERLGYIETLGQVKQPAAVPVLLKVLRSPSHSIRRTTLVSLAAYDDPAIGTTICNLIHSSLPDEQGVRAAALATLTSRPAWSKNLLEEVSSSRLKPGQIPIDLVQKMKMHKDADIDAAIEKQWGKIRGASPAEKLQLIEKVAKLHKSDPRNGDPRNGKALFTALCAACHMLFNEGGKIGPDLTGYERTNLEFLIPAVVDPSMAIREEFTAFVITTKDGRTLTGFLGDQNDRTVSIKGVDNVAITLPRDQVASLNALPVSLMPEGLLGALNDQQIKDLMGYLTSPTPIGR